MRTITKFDADKSVLKAVKSGFQLIEIEQNAWLLALK